MVQLSTPGEAGLIGVGMACTAGRTFSANGRGSSPPHQDGFFPGAPQMLRERLRPLSPEAKHQVLAGGALGFYGLS